MLVIDREEDFCCPQNWWLGGPNSICRYLHILQSQAGVTVRKRTSTSASGVSQHSAQIVNCFDSHHLHECMMRFLVCTYECKMNKSACNYRAAKQTRI